MDQVQNIIKSDLFANSFKQINTKSIKASIASDIFGRVHHHVWNLNYCRHNESRIHLISLKESLVIGYVQSAWLTPLAAFDKKVLFQLH